MYWTDGQPSLVNKMAADSVALSSSQAISGAMVDTVGHNLLVESTHFVQLFNLFSKLPHFVSIACSLLASSDQTVTNSFPQDDLNLLTEFGLLSSGKDEFLKISCAFYREALPNFLMKHPFLLAYAPSIQPSSHVEDGKLHFDKLLSSFQQHCRENLDIFIKQNEDHAEAAFHLLLFTFLKRVLKGCRLSRDYSIGRGYTDVLIEYQQQRFAIKIKTFKDDFKRMNDFKRMKLRTDASADKLKQLASEGVSQLKEDLNRFGLKTDAGFLVIWDQRQSEKIATEKIDGVSVYRC
jgi:hypothetical protein